MSRLLLLALLLSTACAGAPLAPDGVPWHSPLGHEHPLLGQIWHQRQQRFVPPAAAVAQLVRTRHILLGEKHDNPDHHRLQAWILRQLVDRGRRPALLAEMIDSGQQKALDAFGKTGSTDPDALAKALNWSDSGWPDFAMYRAIFAVALEAHLTVAPANLPKATVRQVAHKGLDALPEAQRQQLGLHRPFPDAFAAAMAAEAIASHCNMLPASAAAAMAAAQRVRDAQMAWALAAAGRTDGSVLIAGKGHTRGDRGAPWHLRQADPKQGSVSVHFVEVPQAVSETDAAALGADSGADFIWFTARVDDEDPCAKYAEVLKKMRRSRGKR